MTRWLKDVILDVVALSLILIYAITSNTVLEIILWVYTVLLLLGKVLYFSFNYLQKKADTEQVPSIFYHFIYLISVAALIFSPNYYLAAAWLVIWILSAIAMAKKQSKTSPK